MQNAFLKLMIKLIFFQWCMHNFRSKVRLY